MAEGHDPAEPRTAAEPRVRCLECGFVWWGRTAAHGLSVLGHCARCGGELHFRERVASADLPEGPAVAEGMPPWQVLGSPEGGPWR